MPTAHEKSSEKPAVASQKDIEASNDNENNIVEDWVMLEITPSIEAAPTGDGKLTTVDNHAAINSYLKEFNIPQNWKEEK